METLMNIIGVIISIWAFFYCNAELCNSKINYRNKFFWILLFIISLFVVLATNNIVGFVRIILSYLLLVISAIKLHNISINKATIVCFISYFILVISEFIYTIFVVTIFGVDAHSLSETYFATLATSIAISTIQCFIISFKSIKNILSNFASRITSENIKSIFSFSILTIITFIVLASYVYFDNSDSMTILITITLVLSYGTIVLTLFKEQMDKIKLKSSYEITLNNLKEYEKLYARERLQSHENKNDLMVIRGLTKENKVINYIDKLLKFDDTKNDNWIDCLKRIPEGGLQGLLYCKLCLMEDKGISVNFSIGRKFSSVNYLNIGVDLQAKLCKLIGIFIDNAIDAVGSLEQKYIDISINEIDNNIVIKIANNYSGKLNLDCINKPGYTTKENGHGYGLTIVKDIVDSEKFIIHNTSISGHTFIQEVKIKL